jgi:hypothetical protein
MANLTKKAPEWHAKVAAEIAREYAETNAVNETIRQRRARLGLMLIWTKEAGKADLSIPHGQFGDWLEKNLPEIPRSTLGDYITEAKSICDLLHWKLGELPAFKTPPHLLLSAKVSDLKGPDKEHHGKLVKVIEQQSHFRAITKYAQVELKDDATVPKVGRAKGEGGASKEQRHAAKLKLRELAVKERQLKVLNIGEACAALAEDPGLVDPEIADERATALPQIAKLYQLMMTLEQKRGAK